MDLVIPTAKLPDAEKCHVLGNRHKRETKIVDEGLVSPGNEGVSRAHDFRGWTDRPILAKCSQ